MKHDRKTNLSTWSEAAPISQWIGAQVVKNEKCCWKGKELNCLKYGKFSKAELPSIL